MQGALLTAPDKALRLLIAQMLFGSGGVHVTSQEPGPAQVDHDAGAELAALPASEALEHARVEALALVDVEADGALPLYARGYNKDAAIAQAYSALCKLDDGKLLPLIAFIATDALDTGTSLTDWLGEQLGVDLTDQWRAGEVFVGMVHQKATLAALIENVSDATKAQGIMNQPKPSRVAFALDLFSANAGEWLPGWLRFPATALGIGAPPACTERAAKLDTAMASDVDSEDEDGED